MAGWSLGGCQNRTGKYVVVVIEVVVGGVFSTNVTTFDPLKVGSLLVVM